MKLVLTVALLLLVSRGVSAQEPPFPAHPVDAIPGYVEYGNLRLRDEKAMLDHWAARFRQAPDNIIYILAYSGRRACRGEARARALRAQKYLAKEHGIKADRVIWRDSGFRENLSVELWLRPRDEAPPEPSPTVDPTEVKFIKGCKSGMRGGRGTS